MLGFKKIENGKTYLTDGLLGARYRRHPRTIKRWRKDPKVRFPEPDLIINGKAYTSVETADTFDERARITAA